MDGRKDETDLMFGFQQKNLKDCVGINSNTIEKEREMITYEKAKELALARNKRVNTCVEYQVAYHFFEKEYNGVGDNGVVVLKETGKIRNFVSFLCEYHPERCGKKRTF